MHQQQPADNSAPQTAESASYPHGRGYGHDYMRGGEVFGGYGYSERDDYARRRGEAERAGSVAGTGERRRMDDGNAVS